jgi:hypothetical protein
MRLSVSAKARTQPHIADGNLEIDVEIRDAEQSSVVYYRGAVCLADRAPDPATLATRSRREEGPCRVTAAEAYRSRLFHGRSFQCLTRIYCLTKDGVHAAVRPTAPADCLRDTQAGSWIIDPVLLDAGPQLAILWAQETRGMTVLPTRIRELKIYRKVALNTGLECRLVVDHVATVDHAVVSHFEIFGAGGRLAMSVRGLESVGTKSLNGLAGASNSLGANEIRLVSPP